MPPLEFGLPQFSGMNFDWSGVLPTIMWMIIIGLVLFIVMKYMQFRRLVEVYEKVHGGYVCRGGRYKISKGRSDGREYLKPMFGGKVIPSFPSDAWQKCNSIPFIGVNRLLRLIKMNEHSYKMLFQPVDVMSKKGIAKYHDTLTWVYLEQLRLFKKTIAQKKFLYWANIIAPSAIIISCIVLLVFSMYAQGSIVLYGKEGIDKATAAILQYCEVALK